MPESYRAMEQRHAAMDAHEHQREYAARWAGSGYQSCPDVAEVEPARVRDCTNCRQSRPGRPARRGQDDTAPYWCIALGRSVFHDGKAGCSGWPWDPK